jgi:hypothetical protein
MLTRRDHNPETASRARDPHHLGGDVSGRRRFALMSRGLTAFSGRCRISLYTHNDNDAAVTAPPQSERHCTVMETTPCLRDIVALRALSATHRINRAR